MFYFAKNYTGWIKSTQKSQHERQFEGETDDLGNFKVKVDIGANKSNVFLDAATGNANIAFIKENLVNNQYFKRRSSNADNLKEYIGLKGISDIESSNFIVYQISGFLPLEFEVIFESESAADDYKTKFGSLPKELKGAEFDSMLAKWNTQFQNKFEKIFKLRATKQNSNTILSSQSTLSNLIGGIGFFSGQSLVKSMYTKEPVLYWQSNLYTAVPSRSFFPRGFLWDEGFHNILINQWDSDITRDIVSHWLDLINIEGWIPR